VAVGLTSGNDSPLAIDGDTAKRVVPCFQILELIVDDAIFSECRIEDDRQFARAAYPGSECDNQSQEGNAPAWLQRAFHGVSSFLGNLK
jgi:hypothetical protein